MFSGQLENGATIQGAFGKTGNTLNVGISMLKAPEGAKGTLDAVEKGINAAAKTSGADTVTIFARGPNAAMARALRMRGFKPVVEEGKETGDWVKTIAVGHPGTTSQPAASAPAKPD